MKLYILATSLILSLSNHSGAAVIAGTDQGGGVWMVGTTQFEIILTNSGFVSDLDLNSSPAAAYHLTSGVVWRRSTNVTISLGGTGARADLNMGGSFGGFYSAGPGMVTDSDDNWALLSLESGETSWDTAIQVFVDAAGNAEIRSIWHDDSATDENVLQGVTDFSQIGASVPEPSSLLLGLLGIGGLAMRRSRQH